MRGQRRRLAGVLDLGGKEFVETGIDALGKLAQERHPLGYRHAAPWSLESGASGTDGSVHLGPASGRNLANNLAGHRIVIGKTGA